MAKEQIETVETEVKQPNWFMRHKILTGIIAIIVFFFIIGSSGSDSNNNSQSNNNTTNNTTQSETDESATPIETLPDGSFGNGTHVIGTDIQAGTYRSQRDSLGVCYWSRLSGFSGELEDIIANGNYQYEIVTILPTDAAFESTGCGQWIPVENTYLDIPETIFSDGTHEVGKHIEAGTYRADGNADELCYWARLSNFSHSGTDGIIANGNSPTVIEIKPTDIGFTTFGCGVWEKV